MRILRVVVVSKLLEAIISMPGCGTSDQDIESFFKTHKDKTASQVEEDLGEADRSCVYFGTAPVIDDGEALRDYGANRVRLVLFYGDYALHFNWFGEAIGAGRAESPGIVVAWRDGCSRPEPGQ
jgi:hypothetical protein